MTAISLQIAEEAYCKMCQLFYCKTWQLLQNARKLLQNAIVITKMWRLLQSESAYSIFLSSFKFVFFVCLCFYLIPNYITYKNTTYGIEFAVAFANDANATAYFSSQLTWRGVDFPSSFHAISIVYAIMFI